MFCLWCPWLDPTVLLEADGNESNKKLMKTMTWPLMDEDAAPNAYVTKVLACLSKWRVKMQTVIEAFSSSDDEPEHLKQILDMYQYCIPIHCSNVQIVSKGCFLVNDSVNVIVQCFGRLRIGSRANEIDADLAKISDAVTKINTTGVINGFKTESTTWFWTNLVLKFQRHYSNSTEWMLICSRVT